jgi:hypothetical protein
MSDLGKVCIRAFRNNNNAEFHTSLLQDRRVETNASYVRGSGTWISQHDDSPVHTSATVKNHLLEAGIRCWSGSLRALTQIR